jgi:hypothetical protein
MGLFKRQSSEHPNAASVTGNPLDDETLGQIAARSPLAAVFHGARWRWPDPVFLGMAAVGA